MKKNNVKNYDILDITKIILALLVVAIHSRLLPLILYPWLRIAVPLFFIISSYLLFTKIKDKSEKERKNAIKTYIIRLLKLYIFWFIILLPVTIYVRRVWFEKGILYGIINILIRPFLSSTFVASWYISSTILGTLVVEKLSKKINNKILVILAILCSLLCCLTSSYKYLLQDTFMIKIMSSPIYIEPQFSFLVSIIYILFGKIIAEKGKIINNKNINIILIIITSIMLYVEWRYVYKISGTYDNDCYIMLIPLSILIFNLIIDIKISIKNSKKLRHLSNFIYPLHGSIAGTISICLNAISSHTIINGIICYIITIIICLVCFTIVKLLENRFSVLKISY